MTPTPEGRALVDTEENILSRQVGRCVGEIDSLRMDCRLYRHTIAVLTGGDKAKAEAAEQQVIDYFESIGREKIGAILPAAALAAMQQPASGDLERWGKAPEGSPFLLQPMADGYWAPWHVAAAQLAAKDRELQELRQACWEARATLGFDNDGDPTPDALAFPTLAVMVKRDAAEFRKDYDDACNEADTERKRADAAMGLLAECLEVPCKDPTDLRVRILALAGGAAEAERLERGRKAWADVPDAADWVRDIRGTNEDETP